MAFLNLSSTACPYPFLAESDYPYTAGANHGRFCGSLTPDQASCCLPCPLEDWLYSDSFKQNAKIAYWFNVPGLVCQVLLLLSFAVLKEKHSHVHYLSIGLCVSLILLEMAFIVPLGRRPGQCYDAVTPNDMHSDLTCAWSGALLEAGAMAGAIWILMRSLWTHLRVCLDFKHTPWIFWLAQAFGLGIPAMFLAISLPITGVSYRFGKTCFPNQQNAFVTWFGWLLAFACLAAMIQFITTGFCLWVYLRHFWQSESSAASSTGDSNVAALTPDVEQRPRRAFVRLGKRLAWRRVRKLLLLQWRSIGLNLLVIIESIYFAVIFVAQTRAARRDSSPDKTLDVEAWAACLVITGGNKNACLHYTNVFGLSENMVIASLFMSALIGWSTFGFMVRSSMLVGWYELIKHPIASRRKRGPELFVAVNSKNKTTEKDPLADVGILSEPSESVRHMSMPEAGDVGTRHETTNWFDDEAYEEEELARRRERDEHLNDMQLL